MHTETALNSMIYIPNLFMRAIEDINHCHRHLKHRKEHSHTCLFEEKGLLLVEVGEGVCVARGCQSSHCNQLPGQDTHTPQIYSYQERSVAVSTQHWPILFCLQYSYS